MRDKNVRIMLTTVAGGEEERIGYEGLYSDMNVLDGRKAPKGKRLVTGKWVLHERVLECYTCVL